MSTAVKSKLWWVVLAGLVAGTALLIAGCSSDDPLTAPESSTTAALGAEKMEVDGPPVMDGDIVIDAPSELAPWFLQGAKKARNESESGTGYAEFFDITLGEYTVTWFPYPVYQEGVYAPSPLSETAVLKNNQTLTFTTNGFLRESVSA